MNFILNQALKLKSPTTCWTNSFGTKYSKMNLYLLTVDDTLKNEIANH